MLDSYTLKYLLLFLFVICGVLLQQSLSFRSTYSIRTKAIASSAGSFTTKTTVFQCSSSSESSRQIISHEPKTEQEWGQSYIGQDVCGSRLNVDPFGEQSDKPDAWEEMKRRIDAALQKREKELTTNIKNTENASFTNTCAASSCNDKASAESSGRWPP